jgi:hypothetical protein
MNTQTQEALKMAIEVMYRNSPKIGLTQEIEEAINACKEALEQPAQEPKSVGFIRDLISIDKDGIETYKVTPVYTHPHQWQGLTDDEIQNILNKIRDDMYPWKDGMLGHLIARAIEQALKEKNHG